MDYSPYILDEASSRIENILKMELSDLHVSDRLPSADDLNKQSVRKTNGSVVCVKYTIVIKDVEKKMKMQRLIASEFFNILKSHTGINDIQSVNNAFVALYDTPLKSDIDSLLEMVAKINALSNYCNYVMPSVSVKIAMDYSQLMVARLGLADSSNDRVCYSGTAVEKTLGMVDNTEFHRAVLVTDIFHKNLKKEYQDFFSKEKNDVYGASVINNAIDGWINK